MTVSFKHQHPLFGTKRLPKAEYGREDSVYYWWWCYLKRNTDYLRCCANNGKGKLSKLYKDFGDVRDDDFKKWWNERGVDLFAEQKATLIEEVNEVSKDGRWFIAVSLDYDKKQLKAQFNRMLKKVHTTKRGRKKTAIVNSTAKYKTNKQFTIQSLKNALKCFDEYTLNEKRSKSEKLYGWQIAKKLGLCDFEDYDKEKYSNVDRRNTASATYQRYLKQAIQRIKATADGVFPSA